MHVKDIFTVQMTEKVMVKIIFVQQKTRLEKVNLILKSIQNLSFEVLFVLFWDCWPLKRKKQMALKFSYVVIICQYFSSSS